MPVDLSTPEAKEAIKAVVDAAIEDATTGLVAKNRELLGELKVAKAKARGADIDPVEHQNLVTRGEELQSQVDKLTKEGAASEKKMTKLLESEKGFTRKLLVDNGLTEAAAKVGVKPEFLPAVKSLFASQVQVVEDGDTRVAKVGDKAILEHMTAWAATDEGKHFIAAPNNSGGGAAGGSKGGGATKTMTRSAFDGLDLASKVEFSKAGGSLTDA